MINLLSRLFLTLLAAIGLSNVLSAMPRVAHDKPNVILIITDDQSWDTLGFMGGEVYTPRLDRMAQSGLLLTDFNITSTVCSPSRYSYLTGRYAGHSTGPRIMEIHPLGEQTQIENNIELEEDRWNLAKILQQYGYRTGFVGKNHIVKHDWLNSRLQRGPFKKYSMDADPRDPEVNEKMRYNHEQWCEILKPYGFDFVDGVYPANLRELYNDALDVHNLEWTVDKVFDFMEESKDEPFFLYFATTLHHGPAPWINKYSLDADPRMTGEGFVAEGFDVMPSRDDVLRRNREAGFEDDKAFALWLDDGMGAILDKLKELGIEKNTLVIFASDHGSWRYGKTTLHDNGMRVPIILQWTGVIDPGSTYDGITANIDIAPTVLDIIGIEPPSDYDIDGLSFKHALFGNQEPIRNYLMGELGHSRAVKSKDWKYIAVRYPPELQARIDRGEKFKPFYDGDPPLERPYLTRNSHLGHHSSAQNPHYFDADQLYNLNADPQETINVFDQYPRAARHMKTELAELLRQFESRPFGEFTGRVGK